MRRPRVRGFLVAVAVAATATGASLASLAASRGGGSGDVRAARSSPDSTLAPPSRPAFSIPAPTKLRASRFESAWAPVRSATAARAEPRRDAPVVGRLTTRTPEGTTNLVLALDRAEDADGSLWIHARLPVLPNDTTGWVPRSALGGYSVVTTRLVVDLGERRATLFRDGRAIFRAPVGIGVAQFPTPTGDFYIRNKLTRYRNAFYGPIAFGTSARSETLTDWPAGGFVGIHGTNRPDLIPGRVSHGCIRLRNAAIVRLARLLPVGTPLRIRA